MKKPEKKECICKLEYCECGYDYYNQGLDDYERYLEAYLPTESEIEDIIDDVFDVDNKIPNWSVVAKAIYKRIRG